MNTLNTPVPRTFADPRWLLAIAVLGLVWAIPIWHLSTEWNLNPQYGYGWAVPLLSLYLIYVRRQDQPTPSAPWLENQKIVRRAALGLILLYLPLILFRVANPDWRPLGYIFAFQAIFLTWLGIYMAAGWKVAWHFAFPIAFFVVAVPWPRPIDAPLMDYLMQKNAAIAIEGLLWDGIAAMRKGNLVMLPTGTVGVDEACSGIRSLQGTLMLALFLGELQRLGLWRRIALVGAGIILALITNSVRTFLLARVAGVRGTEHVESWHDSAGLSILVINFVFLWLGALCLARLPNGNWKWFADWWSYMAYQTGTPTRRWTPPKTAWVTLTALVLLFSSGFASWWYERGATHALPALEWNVQQPVDADGFKRERMPDRVVIDLRLDDGWTGKWNGPSGIKLQAWYLRWLPGQNSPQLATMHDPRVCLGGLGLDMQAELATWEFRHHGLVLPVRTLRFKDGNNIVHVYYALIEDKPQTRMTRRLDNSLLSRIEAAWDGIKHRGQRMVEIGVWGDIDESEARKEAEQFLRSHVVIAGSSPPSPYQKTKSQGAGQSGGL